MNGGRWERGVNGGRWEREKRDTKQDLTQRRRERREKKGHLSDPLRSLRLCVRCSNAVSHRSSGYNEQDVTQRFVGKGLAGFIEKPYQAPLLLAKLREVLSRSDS